MKLSKMLRDQIIHSFRAAVDNYAVGQYDKSPETAIHFKMLAQFMEQRDEVRRSLPDFAKAEQSLQAVSFLVAGSATSRKLFVEIGIRDTRYSASMNGDFETPVGFGTAANRCTITGEIADEYLKLQEESRAATNKMGSLKNWFAAIVNQSNTVEQVVCACPTAWQLLPESVRLALYENVPSKGKEGWHDRVREVENIVTLTVLLNATDQHGSN